MKAKQKFTLDIWGLITLGIIGVYLLFLLYPMAHLMKQSVYDPQTGQFSMENFIKFFSKSYYLNTLLNSFKGFLVGYFPFHPHRDTAGLSLFRL